MGHALLCVLALELTAGASESSGNPHLAPARQLLKEFKEEEALKVLAKAQRWPMNTPQELAQTHLLMGLAWAALAREDSAVESFRLARLLAPQLTLPEDQAPRVKEWWARAAADAAPQGDAPKVAPIESTPEVVAPVAAPLIVAEPVVIAPTRAVPATRWVGVAGLGAGVVLTAIAVLQGVLANGHFSSAQRLTGVGEAQAEYLVAVGAAQRANWLYVIGGVVLAGGGLTFALSF